MKTKYLVKLRSLVLAFLTINFLSLPLIVHQSLAEQQVIVSPDQGRGPFIKAIESAEKYLKICAYAFSDPKITDTVYKAAKRGV